jgi:hypothetical protein
VGNFEETVDYQNTDIFTNLGLNKFVESKTLYIKKIKNDHLDLGGDYRGEK